MFRKVIVLFIGFMFLACVSFANNTARKQQLEKELEQLFKTKQKLETQLQQITIMIIKNQAILEEYLAIENIGGDDAKEGNTDE